MARWEKNNLLLNSITNFFGAPCQDTNSSTMRNIHRRCRRDLERTRPSVNQAKVWLDHLFTFPGLIWSGKGFRLKDLISAMPERKHFFLSGECPYRINLLSSECTCGVIARAVEGLASLITGMDHRLGKLMAAISSEEILQVRREGKPLFEKWFVQTGISCWVGVGGRGCKRLPRWFWALFCLRPDGQFLIGWAS